MAAPRRRIARLPRQSGAGGFTTSATEYAQMLCDPCNATLKAPLYPGTTGSNVMRYRAETVLGDATTTACVVAYHPVLGAWGRAVAGGTTQSPLLYLGDAWPGDTFLNATISIASYRGVAGCMQVAYPGTEMNRGGYVSLGVINGKTVWNVIAAASGGGGFPVTPASLLETLTHSQRMPVDEVECAWVPSFGDQEFGTQLGSATSDPVMRENFEKSNFVLLVVQGATASTAGVIRITNTSIVEVNWADGRGLVSNAAHVQTNPTTFTQVIAALQRKDPHWYINAAKKVGKLVGAAAGGYASGGMLGMATSLMGLNLKSNSSRNIG